MLRGLVERWTRWFHRSHYGRIGEVLPGGSPVGLMGGPGDGSDLLAASAGSEGGATRSETLYIEMRQDNEPVDPLAWFQTDKEG